jgi:hypothetical protein
MAYRQFSWILNPVGSSGNASVTETVGLSPGIIKAVGIHYIDQPVTTTVRLIRIGPTDGDEETILQVVGNTKRPISSSGLTDAWITGTLKIEVTNANPANPGVVVTLIYEA